MTDKACTSELNAVWNDGSRCRDEDGVYGLGDLQAQLVHFYQADHPPYLPGFDQNTHPRREQAVASLTMMYSITRT